MGGQNGRDGSVSSGLAGCMGDSVEHLDGRALGVGPGLVTEGV